ncbi:KTSC domain-containing protein [Elizabethkingia anophelis]|nr:KTSC domain-containing protein [Elizabethkingia anophelis]
MNRVLLSFAFIILVSCSKTPSQNNSNKDPHTASTYNEALSIINANNYIIEEQIDTSNSDWITSVEYRADDPENGYLIIGMNGKEYTFDGVPIDIWEDMKEAEDIGEYYNENIRGFYTMSLNRNSDIQSLCKAITKKGTQCSRVAKVNGYCFQHQK